MDKAIFFSSYHDGVNTALIEDFQALGYTVYMPDSGWGKIWFFAPNQQFTRYDNVRIVSYDEFLKLEPMIIMAACVQHYEDFRRLWHERGEVDQFLYLTATQDANEHGGHDEKYLLSHDIGCYRKGSAIAKMLYFNRPPIVVDEKKDIVQAYQNGGVNCYINHLRNVPYHAMVLGDIDRLAGEFPVKEYGLNCRDGMLDRVTMQHEILKSKFTVGIKHWETFGQTITESMLLWTPTIHLRKFTINTLKYYQVTEDTAVLCDTVEECIARMKNMSMDEYECLCMQARASALQMTSKEARLEELDWLLSKIVDF